MSLQGSCIPVGFLESERKGKIYFWFIGNSTYTLWNIYLGSNCHNGEKRGKMLGTARLETQYSLMSAAMEEEKVEIASEKTTLRPCKWSCLH